MAFFVELYFMLIKFYNFNILAKKYCVGYLYVIWKAFFNAKETPGYKKISWSTYI